MNLQPSGEHLSFRGENATCSAEEIRHCAGQVKLKTPPSRREGDSSPLIKPIEWLIEKVMFEHPNMSSRELFRLLCYYGYNGSIATLRRHLRTRERARQKIAPELNMAQDGGDA